MADRNSVLGRVAVPRGGGNPNTPQDLELTQSADRTLSLRNRTGTNPYATREKMSRHPHEFVTLRGWNK